MTVSNIPTFARSMHLASTTGPGFGGFMGAEPLGPSHERPFPEATLLTSGRACLAWILDLERPTRVRVPYYTCDALLAPLHERGLRIEYYGIDSDLLPVGIEPPGKDELIVFTDFFGVRGAAIRELAKALGPRAVIDSTHAYFDATPPTGYYGFNSVRKFRGTPDGAFLFSPQPPPQPQETNSAVNGAHLELRNTLDSNSALAAYRDNELHQSTRFIGASASTQQLLHLYDHDEARDRRCANFAAAHAVLKAFNQLEMPETSPAALCYPFLPAIPVEVERLYGAGIFAPRYWPEVLARDNASDFPWETDLAQRLIAFPVDQRYTPQQTSEYAWQLTRML